MLRKRYNEALDLVVFFLTVAARKQNLVSRLIRKNSLTGSGARQLSDYGPAL